MRSPHPQRVNQHDSVLPPQAPDSYAPPAGNWLVSKLLLGLGFVLFMPGLFLCGFVGAIWMTQAGSGGAVNPGAPLLFFLGVFLLAGGIGMSVAGARMSRRIGA